mmetsp:Transcript_38756/g.60318  ORF Transcript_38756/g.60318 Transcript_38756/m.60318 type:complete len:277 (+) Transcript_38756:99-929(+)
MATGDDREHRSHGSVFLQSIDEAFKAVESISQNLPKGFNRHSWSSGDNNEQFQSDLQTEPSEVLLSLGEFLERSPPLRPFEANDKPINRKGNAANLLERTSILQESLARCRHSRQERALSLQKLDSTLRKLRDEALEERCLLDKAESESVAINASHETARHKLEELQDAQCTILSRKATLEAEICQCRIAEERERATCPETEALKDAKVALAEALSDLDEAKFESKKTCAALQQEVDALRMEQARLLEANAQPVTRSFGQSMWHLLRGTVDVPKGN